MKKLKVVYSEEEPVSPVEDAASICPPEPDSNGANRRSVPGSTAFVPSVAGLIIAGEVIKDLTTIRAGASCSRRGNR